MFDVIKSNPIIWVIIFLAVVAPSFLVGAMKVVLYIILGIILLFFVLSLVFRVKINNMRSQMEEQMRGGGQGGASRGERRHDKEGDVKIFTTPSAQEKRVRKDVGDYVDFEEIKK